MRLYYFSYVLLFLLFSCGTRVADQTQEKSIVLLHLGNPPSQLHPYRSTGEHELFINQHIFQPLLRIDLSSGQLFPVLAKERPEKKIQDSLTFFKYRIRPEAKWPDGRSVTVRDVAFSLKVIKNPFVSAEALRGYLSYIEDIIMKEGDSLSFVLRCGPDFILSESTSGDFDILPEHLYDPEGLLQAYRIDQLSLLKDDSAGTKALAFAKRFNSMDYKEFPGSLAGSGPYELQEWRTAEVALKKRMNWWGDRLASSGLSFTAYPEMLVFRHIADLDASIYAMKTNQLDVMRSVPASRFERIMADSLIRSKFKTSSPIVLAFFYLGCNSQLPKLSSVKTRQAIAHMINRKKIVDFVHRGYAIEARGPVLPGSTYFNAEIKPYVFDTAIAMKLLYEDGWRDLNKDGTLEKTIRGKEYALEFSYLFPAGNEERKTIGLLLQESLAACGIKCELEGVDFATFTQRLKHKEFELMVAGRSIHPLADDPEGTFHTQSILSGGNYVSFGDQQSDTWIEKMKLSPEKERIKLSKQLQAKLHQDASFIFLYHPKDRIIVNNKFEGVVTSSVFPRLWVGSLRIPSKK
jgi:peptide/nickel transport system substrate-binding protein